MTLYMPLLGTRNLPHVLNELLWHVLGRVHPEVAPLTSAFMQPAACKHVHLNLHAKDNPKFACKSRRVTCQLSRGDGGPSTSTWTAASFLSTAC